MFDFKIAIENIIKSDFNNRQIIAEFSNNLNISFNLFNDMDVIKKIYFIAFESLKKEFYFEALTIFLFCHKIDFMRHEIIKIIIDNYYYPFFEIYEHNYNENIRKFKEYENIFKKEFIDFSKLDYLFMPMNKLVHSESEIWLKYSKKEDKFEIIPSYKMIMGNDFEKINFTGKRNIFYNVFDVNFLIKINNKISMDLGGIFTIKPQSYLYYESFEEFVNYLQIINFTELLNTKQSIFMFGFDELEKYMLNPYVIINGSVYANSNQNAVVFVQKLQSIISKKIRLQDETKKKVNDYYSRLTPEIILDKIRNKTVTIAFIISKFSIPTGYYIRDFNEALKKASIKSEIYNEKDDSTYIYQYNQADFIDFLDRVKPDIIMMINKFRWDWPDIPNEVVFINWLQDTHSNLWNSVSANKLSNIDFIATIYAKNEDFNKIGYMTDKIAFLPVLSNPDIFYPQVLNEFEKKEYSADLCIISDTGNTEVVMNEQILSAYANSPDFMVAKKVYYELYNNIFEDIYYERNAYYNFEDARLLFIEYFIKKYKITSTVEIANKLAWHFWELVVVLMHKDIPLLWLHEKGYDMKLWGRAWLTHPILKKYAKGYIKNGELMSKILNASKMSIGLGFSTLHPRLLETIFSGGFFITNNVPEKFDHSDARPFLTQDKELILFKNKKDLYEKVDYYLANEKERHEIINNGRKKALKVLTYEEFFKNLLLKIENKLLTIKK